MSTPSIAQHRARFSWPRLSTRGVLNLLADADARYRDRANLRALDEFALRDIGVSRADVAGELRRGSIW
jgi:uncharacterized protein YjiS (DUF1127 family)